MPHEPVPIDAELASILHIPRGPPRSLRVDGTGTVEVLVNGQALSAPLQAGANDLAIRWKAHWNTPTAGEAHLRFEWKEPDGPWETIPRRAFLLPHGLSFGALAWLLVLLAVAGATSALIYRAARSPRKERRRTFYAVALIAVGVLALGYRLFDYPVAPSFDASDDELFATWNGWSLLHGEGPRGWSLWPHRYAGRSQIEPYYYFRTLPHFVISPYFEHPPGLHLLAGIAATLGGATHWSDAKFTYTRLVPIALSMIAMLFMFPVISRAAFDPREASGAGGENDFDQLGLGPDAAGQNLVPTTSRIGAESDWTRIAQGDEHGCALKADGGVYCFGRNSEGQLGVGDTLDRDAPTGVCFPEL